MKQFERHILTQLGTAKIESIRFRSIAFQNPTSQLGTPEDGGSPIEQPRNKAESNPPSTKLLRPHDRDRISSWRDQKGNDNDDQNNDRKQFLTPQQKRKIAFIHQAFHSNAETTNAYIVFAHAVPSELRPLNLPHPPPTMDPYDAARLAVKKLDGTIFMDHMIRVDAVTHSKRDGDKHAGGGDPKLSIFVGNLDFASKEDDLRVFFEGMVSAERGPPVEDSGSDHDSNGEKIAKHWVTRIRIIRDKDTQLGKGFAYVQFAVSAYTRTVN